MIAASCSHLDDPTKTERTGEKLETGSGDRPDNWSSCAYSNAFTGGFLDNLSTIVEVSIGRPAGWFRNETL